MKIALITTTINIPHVLALYRQYGPDVRFFVAGDQKTPKETYEFILGMDDTQISMPESGHQYKCSELIGWNCIQRRNIALLEAMKWGAELIVTIDDDVLPTNKTYFTDFQRLLLTSKSELVPPGNIRHTTDAARFSGIVVGSANGWVDPGQLLTPIVQHRGIPVKPYMPMQLGLVCDVKIGVAAGLWVGDADVDATHRMANPPAVHSVTALAEAGVVIDPQQWTVWNAQNVAFIRELAPAMFQAPGIGRADDIWASLITQKIMREHDFHTHVGKPFTACWQERSKASMIRDLEEEILLYKHTLDFAAWLDDFVFEPGVDSVLAQTRHIYDDTSLLSWYPARAREAALAFCDDCEAVL